MENQNEKKDMGVTSNNPDHNLNNQSANNSEKENQNSSNTWPVDDTLEEYLEKDKENDNNKMKPGSLFKCKS